MKNLPNPNPDIRHKVTYIDDDQGRKTIEGYLYYQGGFLAVIDPPAEPMSISHHGVIRIEEIASRYTQQSAQL